MRLSRFLLLALLLAFRPAAADTANDPLRAQALQIATQWLEGNTAYKHIPPVGRFVVLSPMQMQQRGVQAHIPGDLKFLTAIYACGENTIYLKDGVNFMYASELSLLVHELTHHAQCLAHAPMNDTCRVEREAYANQQRFLRWIQPRLANSAQPLSPAQAKEINDLAASIDQTAASVCAAAKRS